MDQLHPIGQLTNLTILDLDSNQLKSLPVEVGQLANLQHLSGNSELNWVETFNIGKSLYQK